MLLERLARRIAEDGEASMRAPVAEEWAADRVLDLREVLESLPLGHGRHRREGLGGNLHAEAAERDLVWRAAELRVIFEAIALEVLDGVDHAGIRVPYGELLRNREAEDGQPA